MHDKPVTPRRAFTTESFEGQPTEAKRLSSLAPRPFMSHGGPKADESSIDRGQFSVRKVLTSK